MQAFELYILNEAALLFDQVATLANNRCSSSSAIDGRNSFTQEYPNGHLFYSLSVRELHGYTNLIESNKENIQRVS